MFEALDTIVGDDNDVPATAVTISAAALGEYMDVEVLEEADSIAELTSRALKLFPDIEADKVETMLAKHNGDLGTVCNDLLDGLAPVESTSSNVSVLRTKLLDSATGPSTANNWQSRADVVSSGLLAALDAKEVKRQEAIAELATSEVAFLADVDVLLELLILPLHKMSIAGESVDPALEHSTVVAMTESTELLKQACTNFLAALRARQEIEPVVSRIGDVINHHLPQMHMGFTAYCTTCFHLQNAMRRGAPGFTRLLGKATADPRSKNLPFDAFIIAPIQRVARLPLLVQAISDRTADGLSDAVDLIKVQKSVRESAQTCNARLRSLEDHATVVQLASSLDWSRIENPEPIVHENRTLVKRGRLDAVRLSKGKVTQKRSMEFMLFNDLLLYCKPLSGKRYTVYKQVHRSLVEVSAFDDVSEVGSPSKRIGSDGPLLEFILHGPETTKLHVQCASMTERARWLEAFIPTLEDDEVFQEFDAPEARVIRDYDAKQADELTLRRGDILRLLSRDVASEGGSIMCKGLIVSALQATHRPTRGWFPRLHCKEIMSVHKEAKIFKANYKHREAKSSGSFSAK